MASGFVRVGQWRPNRFIGIIQAGCLVADFIAAYGDNSIVYQAGGYIAFGSTHSYNTDFCACANNSLNTIFGTRHEATVANWLLFFLAFGWIWMWF